MSERRKRQRYCVGGAWVRWERWSLWRALLGGRIPSGSADAEQVDELVDIAAGGVAFITLNPPARDDRVIVNIYPAEEGEPVVATGRVLNVRPDDRGRGHRVAIRFDNELPAAAAARFRVLDEPEEAAEVVDDDRAAQAETPLAAKPVSRPQ